MKAGNVIKPMRGWEFTEWESMADINGTGTAEVNGGYTIFDNTDLSYETGIVVGIQIEYSIVLTAGTGFAVGAVYCPNFDMMNKDTVETEPSTSGTSNYLAHSRNEPSKAAYIRRWTYFVDVDSWYPNNYSQRKWYLRLAGLGTETDTEWTISDARVRLVYIPY